MLRHIAAFLIIATVTITTVTITTVRVSGQQDLASGTGIISPITGSTQIEHLGTVRWSYHFDHNALKDAELVAGNL